jgi:type IV secretory pathway VirB2 component (pilin)
MSYLILFSSLSFSHSIWARSLKATADKLAQETTRIGFGLAIFGIVLAGIYFMLGRQDASTKMTQALMGVFVLMLAPTIVNFVRGLV